MRQRWLPVGIVALVIFVVNAVFRLISWKGGITSDEGQTSLSVVGTLVVGVALAVAGARWAVRYPFSRVAGDLLLAILVGTVLAVVVGPFVANSRPMADGLESFVAQILLFLAVGFGSALLGFVCMVAVGKDWKSRGLRRYERIYARKATPKKPARG